VATAALDAHARHGFAGAEPEVPFDRFAPTKHSCYMSGAYADVCVYTNLCFKEDTHLRFVSDTMPSERSLPQPEYLTGGIKYGAVVVLVTPCAPLRVCSPA
jgi:hypothetical protein